MAATAIHLKPQDPASYKYPSMHPAASGPPAGYTLAPINTGVNVSAPQLVGDTGYTFVPPIAGSNVLISRRIY